METSKETLSILHLDDSESDLQGVNDAIMRAGFIPHSTATHTPEQFREALDAHPPFDLILVEPEAAGGKALPGALALLSLVRSTPNAAPLIFVGRRIDEWFSEEAYRYGASGFVMKQQLDELAPLLAMIKAQRVDARPLDGFDLCQDPVLIVDADAPYLVRSANPAFERRSGGPLRSFVGRPLSDIDGPQRAFLKAVRSLSLANAQPRSSIMQADNGHECWLDVQCIPVIREGHACTVIMARETTNSHRDEETVQRFQEQLVRSQKMHSVAILASGIAHDFNNILTGIFGSAELARLSLDHDHPAYADLDTIVQASQRAAGLTKELLTYAGRGSRDAEVSDLNQMVTNILVILRSQVSKSIIVRKALAPEAPKICVNVPEIQQVLMNLCINASEAMSDHGGVLSIVTDRAVLDSSDCVQLAYGAPEPGEYAVFEVVDTGGGLPDVARGRLFEPFFSTKGRDRGLGLAAVLRIVVAHRGAISVDSNPDGGTIFRVLLPATAHTVPERSDPPENATHQRRTILFVDDEEVLRSLGHRSLEHLGYRVLLAADGIEAVRLYRQHQAEIDLVVLDLSMPRKGGEDAYREMRAIRSDVRVLLSCGYDQQSAIDKFAPDKLVGFLAKPFGMDQLARAVERALSV
ncbi:MAG: response regulator [Acidiferrobacteraceae bacterium]